MGEATKIQWCHHTFNPWIGCQKVSDGCRFCYAEHETRPRVLRAGGIETWGPKGQRVRTSADYWKQPRKWSAEACLEGVRRRVFCASMADVFEDLPGLLEWRRDLFRLFDATHNLDWLLLTKRPENVERFWYFRARCALGFDCTHPECRADAYYHNVWIGTSCENQETFDKRIPELLKIPAAVRFLSLEPLLGPVNLSVAARQIVPTDNVSWVIVGGESGPHARPCNVEWIRSIVEQCKNAGVACFVKQLGANPVTTTKYTCKPFPLSDPKAGDPTEWPKDLRVREFPR
jgi:protein gp37